MSDRHMQFEEVIHVLRNLRQVGGGTGQVIALMMLSDHGPQNLAQLSARTSMKRASITSIVDGLEEAGLAERFLDKYDRRITMVRLTPEGELRVNAAVQLSELERAAGTLPADEEED